MDEWQATPLPTGAIGTSFLERFWRGFLGALPLLLLAVVILVVVGPDSVDSLVFSAKGLSLLAIPALTSLVAMGIMPVGEEGRFLWVKVLPMVGERLRGVLLTAILLAAWAFAAFVVVGGIGMIWTGLRRLLF